MQGQKTQGLEFFSGALSFQNLREISRLIGRDLKGLHQDEMQKFEKVRQLRSASWRGRRCAASKRQPAAEAALLQAAREAEEDAAGHRPSAAEKQQQISELKERAAEFGDPVKQSAQAKVLERKWLRFLLVHGDAYKFDARVGPNVEL